MRAYQPPLRDPEAFSNLYNRSHVIIFRFIYGLHGGPVEEVEDLTCDTFLRAWRGRIRFVGDDHDALCWLFTIARRLVIDAHRHRRSGSGEPAVLLDADWLETMIPHPQETLEEQAASRDQLKHLWQIMQGLPDEKREMLVLRYMLDWKVKDIASYLRKEENTVSVSIKRCLEQIRHDWFFE
jgi:RNA polymerase sigma-70 factor (ECF subfamily)